MASRSRCFPYEKSVLINALYDTIEALGLSLDGSDSMGGTLVVSGAERIGKLRIALGFGANANQTQVEVFPEESNVRFAEIWTPIILDELAGKMKRMHPLERGETTK